MAMSSVNDFRTIVRWQRSAQTALRHLASKATVIHDDFRWLAFACA
jgi:hypothetical protein